MVRAVCLMTLIVLCAACGSDPDADATPEKAKPVADSAPENAEPASPAPEVKAAEAPVDANRTEEEMLAWRECRDPGWLVLTARDVVSGKPVTDADYHALKFAFDEKRVEPQFSARISHAPNAKSDTGRFRFKLAAGWHQIRIDADGYRNKWTPVFRIEEGKETSIGIEMRKANRLKVIVLDESGKPIGEGGVGLTGDGYRAGMHIENGEGEQLVPVDEVTVTVGDVFLKDYAFQAVTVPLKPGIVNEVKIRLRR
jgi:uncharacterized protein YegP (UPF0339 family)